MTGLFNVHICMEYSFYLFYLHRALDRIISVEILIALKHIKNIPRSSNLISYTKEKATTITFQKKLIYIFNTRQATVHVWVHFLFIFYFVWVHFFFFYFVWVHSILHYGKSITSIPLVCGWRNECLGKSNFQIIIRKLLAFHWFYWKTRRVRT